MATVHFGLLQGAGGFSRAVAIKRLHAQFAKDPDFVAMFVDEARLAARISHPNVVPTLDVVSQHDELLLVMEYVRGTSLSRLLRASNQRGERIPPPIAASIVAGMLRGLHAAHEAKSETGEPLHMVHRDVSPQNVLVGTDGVARVLDFGVAKATGRWQSTQQGQLKGKIPYMAIEQITTGNVTRQTDVYAAAVVLWETLTGKRMFRADNDAQLLSLVIRGEVPPPSEVVQGLSPKFDGIVMRGLERDPAKRFATARDMAAAVEAAVATAPSTDVGEWVERIAADELRGRADRIAEIERVAKARESNTPPCAPESTTVVKMRMRGKNPEREAPSQVLPLPVANTVSPPADEPQNKHFGVLLTVFALCAIGLTAVAVRAAVARNERAPFASSHGSSVGDATASAAPAVVSPFASAWVPLPTAAPIATLDLSAPTLVRSPPANRLAKPSSPAKGSPQRPGCNPPYTTDSKGHVHFRPDCVD